MTVLKKKDQTSAWGWPSHSVWSAELCEGWATLVIWGADWPPSWLPATSTATLTTVASGLLGPSAKPQAPTGSSKAQEAQAVATREPHGILLLMVLLASRDTSSCLRHSHRPSPDQHYLISIIIPPVVSGVIQKRFQRPNIEHLLS